MNTNQIGRIKIGTGTGKIKTVKTGIRTETETEIKSAKRDIETRKMESARKESQEMMR